ncbi:hypothetical protein BB987_11605 [Photorhabdus temperata]|uniref:Phage tail collar family protein n=1 Tax=Photorhabdus khanii NC19 TaxID=1004151 RepID=W3V4S2_9GAMM|nr:tail fiber protein [Photorhabdus khanii]ETS30019.1 phage tail collar family protein [Photorhabdus khanii NC19]OHV53892.1 hypothetical protein BB987_11605 [Photorhabdus temperata]
MKEIRYSVKTQEQQTLTDSKGIGPETDKLKDKFKDGSIPLQKDFNDLIDIADVGRKATGQAPQQNGPGVGLKLDDNGTLNLKMGTLASQDFSPLILEKDILSVELGSGLINKDNGICVGQGNGITVSGNGVEVKAKNNGSISVDSEGIAVKCWDGGGIVVTDNTGLYLKLEGGNPSNAWSGVSGLSLSKNGVKVKAGNGITVNSSGVSIDPNKVLPRGMIVMFSGNSSPTGWAFCDGGTYNGVTVPDLRSRFVMCGETISETGKSSSKASGSGNGKNFSKNTTSTQVSVTVNVQNTTLTESQIPSHQHIGGMAYYMNVGMQYETSFGPETSTDVINNNPSSVGMTKATSPRYAYTSKTGEGKGHNHQATASSPSHSHSVDVVPPYYLLAFIMKL